MDERSIAMNHIYAMQRANGDWFALEDDGRFRVPLFHSPHDALMARLRNFGMLLFKPVPLDTRFLNEIANMGGESEVEFCMVNDPYASLSRGKPLERAQLALQIHDSNKPQKLPGNGNGASVTGVGKLPQSEWWN